MDYSYIAKIQDKQPLLPPPKKNAGLSIKHFSQGFTLAVKASAVKQLDNLMIHYYSKRISLSSLTAAIVSQSKSSVQQWLENLNLWKCVFSVVNERLFYKNGVFSIQSNLTYSTETLSNLAIKNEVYFPIAFCKNDEPVGGAFINLWKTNRNHHKANLPISIFHTGACMFGSVLYGIDQFGEKHSLTEPNYQIPNGRIINKIQSNDSLHSNEILSRRVFENFIPFIKALSDSSKPTIRYHLPLPNYIFYGIIKFLNKEITQQALAVYIKEVKNRAKEHETYLTDIAKKHGLNITCCSSLEPLKLASLDETTIVEDLFKHIGLSKQPVQIKKNSKEISQQLFLKIIKFLSEEDSLGGKIWKIAAEKIRDNALFQINNIDYAANLAISVAIANDKNVCSLFEACEKPISIAYKNFFSNELGNVLCVNHLPPFHISIEEYNNALFYLKDYISEINELLYSGITHFASLQTAAIALGSIDLANYASTHIFDILSAHEASSFIN